jgi:excisionase family DNA binding protein
VSDDDRATGELNLKQVAASLGVHYMTAYRYVRQGRLEARRDGTEWRIPAAVVGEFAARNRAAESDVSTGPGRTVNWASRIEAPLIAGDETAAWRIIENALAAGNTAEYCYIDVVARALRDIGQRSVADELAVADQHVASAVASRIIARLGARFRRPGRTRGNVVFGAPRDEHQTVPIAIYSDLLRLAGFEVLELGADVPVEAFVESVRGNERLICVGIGVTRPEALNAARLIIDAVRLVDPVMPIALGGLGARVPGIAQFERIATIDGDGRNAVTVVEGFVSARPTRRVT